MALLYIGDKIIWPPLYLTLTFENIAYVMAKHADSTMPDTPEEWCAVKKEFAQLTEK